jgi:hypothetical protein
MRTNDVTVLEKLYNHPNPWARQALMLGVYAPSDPMDRYWKKILADFHLDFDTEIKDGHIISYSQSVQSSRKLNKFQKYCIAFCDMMTLMEAKIWKCITIEGVKEELSIDLAVEFFMAGSLISYCQRKGCYHTFFTF